MNGSLGESRVEERGKGHLWRGLGEELGVPQRETNNSKYAYYLRRLALLISCDRLFGTIIRIPRWWYFVFMN